MTNYPITQLSVNINKIATLRNARNNGLPNVVLFAKDCELFGANGITVHPRPDERHITNKDVYDLKQVVATEFNIEGYPSDDFIKMVLEVKPKQVTLVPDAPDAITSNAGWNTKTFFNFLKPIIEQFNNANIRTSLFMGTDIELINYAHQLGTKRIEFYTEPYAINYKIDKDKAIHNYVIAGEYAHDLGLGINAGHDLNLENLNFLIHKMPYISEVSIGHALICDALYYGIQNTIQMYLRALNR